MFKKGDTVRARNSAQKMRVQRDQNLDGPDPHLVWCEWEDAGYYLRAFDEYELTRSACVDEGVTQ